MSTEIPPAPPPADVAKAPPRAPRGHPLIAWAVIVAAAAGLFVIHYHFQARAEVKALDAFEIQARALVGAANVALMGPALYEQARELNHGSPEQRLGFVVLAGELKGPDEALKQLGPLKDELDARTEQQGKDEPSSAEARETAANADTADILTRLYSDYLYGESVPAFGAATAGLLASPAGPLPAASALFHGDLSGRDVSAEQRQELRRRLGWLGDLALNPRNGPDPAARAAVIAPAERLAVVGMSVELLVLGAGGIGFILLILFFFLWRQMRSRVRLGSPFGGVYAETFAVWMVLFVGLGLGASFAARFLPDYLPEELPSGVAFLASLSALAWPVIRGVPWRQVRQDVGWTWGDRPALEPFCGILCYLAALPVLIAVTLFLFLFKLFGRDLPIHPIVPEVLRSGWWGWIQILFLASVAAPIIEETMFRGVLYRHLREATGRMGRWGSVILSALVVSFIFAILHPQGVTAAPVLMVLALGFTAAREWRGSLIPSMTVHALHNGALMVMLILAAG